MNLTSTVLPRIVPLTTPEEVARVAQAGLEDNHGTGYFTDAVLRGPEIVGGFSLMTTPVVNWWMHSSKAGLRDSLQVMNTVEWGMRRLKQRELFLPVSVDSPYLPHMERLGFERVGSFTLYRKGLV